MGITIRPAISTTVGARYPCGVRPRNSRPGPRPAPARPARLPASGTVDTEPLSSGMVFIARHLETVLCRGPAAGRRLSGERTVPDPPRHYGAAPMSAEDLRPVRLNRV